MVWNEGGISVKRLTVRDSSGIVVIDCKSCCGVLDASQEVSVICDCDDCLRESTNRLAAIEDILGDDYDLDRLKELLEKDRNGAFDPYSKFPEKGQEVWYWDSKNGISRGIVDFVNIDFCDNSLNEFGVDFPDENDFDVFNGSAWGTCIVDSMEAALEKMNAEQR